MKVPEHECVWFNLLLKPRTPEHLPEILKEKRDHERTKQASSPALLWWSLVVDVTTWRTCLHQTVPRAQDPSRRTTTTARGHPTWSIRLQSPPHLPACNKRLNCWMDERVSPSWQWEMIWSKEFGRRKPCLSDHLLGLIHVKCESQWPYSAQHTTHTHTQHTHNICTEHTHTQNTHGEHLHSTCTAHTTHPHNLFTEVEWGEVPVLFGLL